MAEHDDTIARAIETLKEPVRIDTGFDGRVMAEVSRLPRPSARTSSARTLVTWLRRRRTIRLSPLGGLAMAAGLAAVVIGSARLAGSFGAAAGMSDRAPPEPVQLMQFVLVAPEAASVTVVGDFNDWNVSATPLVQQDGDGVWWVTVPLAPGRYRYSFVVDGRVWRPDPNAPAVADDFGRANSVVTVGGA